MMFTKGHLALIENGTKTQTRRAWVKPRVKVGKYYPIQVDYRTKAKGYIRILNVRQERLSEITEWDAKARGFGTKGELPDPRLAGREYRKTATIHAVRIDHPFTVHTLEGDHAGKAGDWLARANTPKGEMWVIDADVFSKTYAPVEKSPGGSP